MQKYVNLVDLVESFPTNIFLQNLASIQKRTSPIKFAHLAEKSEKGSIWNLSFKARSAGAGAGGAWASASARRSCRISWSSKYARLEKLTELCTATGLIILYDDGFSIFHRLKCAQS